MRGACDQTQNQRRSCESIDSGTGSFVKAMPNFVTDPPLDPVPGDVFVYHAMPHGLRDPLRHPVRPDGFVDTTPVHAAKRHALAAHASQKEWLDASQGMDSYLQAMEDFSREVARQSGALPAGQIVQWIRDAVRG